MMTRQGVRGFTLVELLVVIAVIAILAAILIPALLTAQERARQTKCMANMRDIAIALNEYADTNRGRYPGYAEPPVGGLTWENGRTDDGIWASRIDGYLGGSESLWICGSDWDTGRAFREEQASAETGVPYGINNNLSMQRPSDGKIVGRPTSAVRSPRTTVLLIENDGYDAGGELSSSPEPDRRHLDGARFFNIVFCDTTAKVVEETRYPEDWDLKGDDQ